MKSQENPKDEVDYLHLDYEPRSTRDQIVDEPKEEIGSHIDQSFKAEINTSSDEEDEIKTSKT